MVSQLQYKASQNIELNNVECWTQGLESSWKANENDATITWQYLATPEGFFRGFPGIPTQQCSGYDPRDKEWYIAATSGPKDVVLVIDVSGSMATAGRIDLAREAAYRVVDALSVFDQFAVVTFDSDSY